MADTQQRAAAYRNKHCNVANPIATLIAIAIRISVGAEGVAITKNRPAKDFILCRAVFVPIWLTPKTAHYVSLVSDPYASYGAGGTPAYCAITCPIARYPLQRSFLLCKSRCYKWFLLRQQKSLLLQQKQLATHCAMCKYACLLRLPYEYWQIWSQKWPYLTSSFLFQFLYGVFSLFQLCPAGLHGLAAYMVRNLPVLE